MMQYSLEKRKINRIDVAWGILFLAAFAASLWKLPYGYVIDDEAFYSTIPNRLSFGDIFFKDEWHLSQLSAFLTLPFVKIFHLVFSTNDGLLLYMRKCYLLLHTIVSAMIYLFLRRLEYENAHTGRKSSNYIQTSSAVSSLLFFMFVPADIMALSYNTLGVELTALSGLFLSCGSILSTKVNVSSKAGRNQPLLFFVLSGFFFAGAVLCCPYLAGIYFIYTICAVVFNSKFYKSRKTSTAVSIFVVKNFLLFSCGVAVPAFMFLIFFFSRAGIKDITGNLKYMLLDPEHQNTSLISKLPRYFSAIILHSVPGWTILILIFSVELIIIFFDKKRISHRSVYFIISCIIMCTCLLLTIPELLRTNFTAIMFPLIFPATVSYFLTERRNPDLFFGLFIPGIFYSICIHLSSNQAFFVIAIAISVSNIAGIIFIGTLINELKAEKNIAYFSEINTSVSNAIRQKKGSASYYLCVTAACICLVFQTGFQTFIRINHTFRDEMPSKLDCRIENGPAKGIITSQEYSSMYDIAYNDLQYYSQKTDGKILILVKEPWYYLETYGKECASYSAWIAEEDENTLHMLDLYYNINPEKIPDYIYISKYTQWDINLIVKTAEENGFFIDEENNFSIKLQKTNE